MGAGAQAEMAYRLPQKSLGLGAQGAVLAQMRPAHVGVAVYPAVIRIALLLHCPAALDPGAYRLAWLAGLLVRQVLERHGRRLHVDIYAVQQWPADMPQVALHLHRRALAGVVGVGAVAAGTGLRCQVARSI